MNARALLAGCAVPAAIVLAWDSLENLATTCVLGRAMPPHVDASPPLPSPIAPPPSPVVVTEPPADVLPLLARGAPRAEIRAAIERQVDPEAITKAAFGAPCPPRVRSCTNHWERTLDDAQRAEVLRLVREIVAWQVARTRDDAATFRFAGAERIGERPRVRASSPALRVDYVVEGSRIVDLVVEGSSFTKNTYEQVDRMLTTPGQGYPHLLARLEAKTARHRVAVK